MRKEFPDTALWCGARTNAQGEDCGARRARPLTTWRATVRAHTRETPGQAVSRITCRKELMVRIQAPRFLTARDEVTPRRWHTTIDATQRVRVSLMQRGRSPPRA